MKTCHKCKISKDLSEFPKCSRNKDGLREICKLCINLWNKQYRLKNLEAFNNTRKKSYLKNIDKRRAEKRDYYKAHKSEKSEYDKNYRKLQVEKIKQYKKNWEELKKDDPIFKIKRNLRRRVAHVLAGNRKADKTFELIGCSPLEFKQHIENQFLEDMSWENYGEWHIDHIKECFRFDLTDPEQQKQCFHYSNQRPLWAIDNLSRPRNTE